MKGNIFVGFLLLLASCLDTDVITPYEQLQKDIKKIDEYLAANGITNVIKDASGVRIRINSPGTLGLPSGYYNDLEVDYSVKYLYGNVIEAKTIYKSLNELYGGWQVALPMLPEGTSATLYLPRGWTDGNNNMIFDVTVVDVTLTDTQTLTLKTDTTAIDNDLQQFDNVIKVPGGLRYIITEPGDGTGATPTIYSQVKIDIRGLLLSDSSVFINQQVVMPTEGFSSRVANFPNGVMQGLQKMKEGDKATFFVPSGLAESKYGIYIPANKNIVFEIKLLDVLN